jgi:phosphate transport system permease protein
MVAVAIYACAIAPYDDWHRQAWAAALALITMVFVASLAVRLATRRRVAAR